jgi:hypothetical protein
MGDRAEPGGEKTKAQLATEGIRQLVASQAQAEGRTTFTLVQFTTGNIETVADFAEATHPKLAKWECIPAGGTPLLDAVGMTIARTGEQLAALPEYARPGRVFFAIATDGQENQSQEYSLEQVRQMITTQRETYGWDFIFLGVGIDAFKDAGAMGIGHAGTMNVNSARVGAAYAAAGAAVSRSRGPGGQSVNFTTREREEAAGEAK